MGVSHLMPEHCHDKFYHFDLTIKVRLWEMVMIFRIRAVVVNRSLLLICLPLN